MLREFHVQGDAGSTVEKHTGGGEVFMGESGSEEFLEIGRPGTPSSKYYLQQLPVGVGRDPRNQMVLRSPEVSRFHCRLDRRDADVVVSDLGSSGGTWVNGQKVSEHVLAEGDTIQVGDQVLVFHAPPPVRTWHSGMAPTVLPGAIPPTTWAPPPQSGPISARPGAGPPTPFTPSVPFALPPEIQAMASPVQRPRVGASAGGLFPYILATLGLLVFVGFVVVRPRMAERQAFDDLKAHPTVQRARGFQADHPGSGHFAEADDIAWQAALAREGQEGIREYLGEFSTGRHRGEADDASWERVKGSKSIDRIEQFLKDYANTPHRQEAIHEEFVILHDQKPGRQAIQDFISRYPASPDLSDARTLLAGCCSCPSGSLPRNELKIIVANVNASKLLVYFALDSPDYLELKRLTTARIEAAFRPFGLTAEITTNLDAAHFVVDGEMRDSGSIFTGVAGAARGKIVEGRLKAYSPGKLLWRKNFEVRTPSYLNYKERYSPQEAVDHATADAFMEQFTKALDIW